MSSREELLGAELPDFRVLQHAGLPAERRARHHPEKAARETADRPGKERRAGER